MILNVICTFWGVCITDSIVAKKNPSYASKKEEKQKRVPTQPILWV
jgi:hypothetical protein